MPAAFCTTIPERGCQMKTSPSETTAWCASGGGARGSVMAPSLLGGQGRSVIDPGPRRPTAYIRDSRQVHDETGALPELALHPNRPVVRQQDLGADVEAQPQAPEVSGGHRPFEAAEDPRLVGRREPDAVVA